MKKSASKLKKILKAIVGKIVIFILLLLLLAILIQIPAIQTRLTNYAVSYISDKTHTRVEFDKIRISFPKSVVLEGLYLEDQKKDTLLYSGELKINIVFKALFKHKVHIRSLSLDHTQLYINRFETDSLFNYAFFLSAFNDTSKPTNTEPKEKPEWQFSLDLVNLKRTNLRYDDAYGRVNASAFIENLTIKDATIDLQEDLVLALKGLSLESNTIIYKKTDQPDTTNAFNANSMEYTQLMLVARDFYYSTDKKEVSVKQFSATDKNNFSVTKLETDLLMDQHNMILKNLKINTSHSAFDADIKLQYPSLNSLSDSIQLAILDIDIKNVSLGNSDILYFIPRFSEQEFFRDQTLTTTISGGISGAVNQLSGKDLIIQTGISTILKTDFWINGLPAIETASFKFPNLTLASTRSDIELLAGTAIPENIDLPEKINLEIAFEGGLKAFESDLKMNSSYGAAKLLVRIDQDENYSSNIAVTNFDLGRLLKNKDLFGPLSLTAEIKGKGTDPNKIRAKIKADVSEIYLNKYKYHRLSFNGILTGKKYEGTLNLNDENALVDFTGLVNLNPGKKSGNFKLEVQGADLKKLNFTKQELHVGLLAVVDLKGESLNDISGNGGITKINVVHDETKYLLDSLIFVSTNDQNKSELNLKSALLDINYKGNLSPVNLPAGFGQFINSFFPFSDSVSNKNACELSDFAFEIRLHNHPILSEVFIPQLKEFDPGLIAGSFDKATNKLKINADMNRMVYGTTEISDLSAAMNSDMSGLNFKIFSRDISNSQIKLENFLLEGQLANQTIRASISSIDDQQFKKFQLHSQITREDGNYRITINPDDFFIMNMLWGVSDDNYFEVGEKGFLIHNLSISNQESQISINSINDQFNDDLNLTIKSFELDKISGIIEKDISFVKGMVNGEVFLKRLNDSYGIRADVKIDDLVVQDVPVGNLDIQTENPSAALIDLSVILSGADNQLTAKGSFTQEGDEKSINIQAVIQSLSMKTVEVLSMGEIKEASGTLSGNISIDGKTDAPQVTGEMTFNKAIFRPAATNTLLELKHETVQFNKEAVIFKTFTILDAEQNTAIIDGTIQTERFKNLLFDLKVNTKDFLLFNTTVNDNKVFNGRMIIDSKIDIDGPMTLPVINAKIKIKKGSNFTFAVPEDKLTTDRGEEVVEFINPSKLNPIQSGDVNSEALKTGFKGFDLSSIIEVDKEATLKLLLDPSSPDSLVVKGEAALSFALDRSGKMSLTGSYNLNEGSYLISLESVIKRRFDIVPGSTIIWSGDPLDAVLSINASYSVRASPYDLVADQISGLSEVEKGGYKQRYPFLVLLKLRGEILQPEISFEIQLPPEEKGILGGAVNQKLNILNKDASALNKQVFALLILGRFIQENPLQTESGGASSLVRSTVGKFLSAQLNQLSSKLITGMEVKFDIQSYDDFQTGQAEGRTQVEVGLKKQLFNERLSIQLGGTVDVEGEKANQNKASDLTGDVTVEYKLTKNGRYRLKAFRHNLYEGAIEGQLVETGVGLVFLRNFDALKELFTRKNKEQ